MCPAHLGGRAAPGRYPQREQFEPIARLLATGTRGWYDTGMTAAKIAITLPQEQLARARRAVRSGQAASVSGYIAAVLTEHEQRESLEGLLLDLIREHGAPTKEDRAWARGALRGRRSRE